jgi:hypothetical protein
MKVEGGSTSSTFILAFISTFINGMTNNMAKKTRISALEYCKLKDAFCNAKYASPGILARLLLESFIFEDGEIYAEWFVREKACTKGTFTKLRDRLVADSWLHFRDDSKRYFPGSRLKPHLDAVKAAKAVTFADLERKADRDEVSKKADKEDLIQLDARKVDKTEFARMADDVQDIKSQIHQINELLLELKILQAPPPNAAAQLRSGEIVTQLEDLMNKTGFKPN